MKLDPNISRPRSNAGILLVECMVYIAVFALLLGIGTLAFYSFWDHSKALLHSTDDIESALHAGERWRADVRSATGQISLESTPAGELLRIPHGDDEVLYDFRNGTVQRRKSSSNASELLFATVKTSQMVKDGRDAGRAWRWELELLPRHKEMHVPLQFTFDAARTKP
jgi:Tfp pilus assembly protein FimT